MSRKMIGNGSKGSCEYNLCSQLLKHQNQMLNFLFYTEYDIIYETFELKHAAYLQKKKGELSKTFKNEEIGKYYKAMSQKTHIRILRDDVGLDKNLARLQILWQYKKVGYFHRYYFMKYLFSAFTRNIEQFIGVEYRLIENQQHIYYSIIRGINAREACLRQLKKNLVELGNQDVLEYLLVKKKRQENNKKKQELEKYQIQGYKVDMIGDDRIEGQNFKTKFEQFSHLFHHLTKLSLYVIEMITNWKKYIYSLSQDQRKNQERIQYYFNDDNYFLKILNDNGFIRVSFLANYYNFAPKNDPFMLKPILEFERQQQKSNENEYLKQIFLGESDLISQILSKVEYLSQQYKHNIRSRKIYDLNIYQRSTNYKNSLLNRNRDRDMSMNRNKVNSLISLQPVSNTILKKYESPVGERKQRFYKVQENGSIKKQNNQIIIEFGESRIKRNTSLPVIKQKLVVEQETSLLRKSIILEKNPVKISNIDKIIDSKLLGVLKEQVIKKFKEQFNSEEKKELNKNQPLEMFIDSKVKQAMKGVFPFEPQKQLKLPIQFTTRSISQFQVGSQVSRMYSKSLLEYSQMQMKQGELLKMIELCQFLYLIRATIGEQVIGDIICTVNGDVMGERSLKVLYIGFYDILRLELLMVKFVDFLMKYQTSNQVVYSFLLPVNNKIIQDLLQTLHVSFNNQALYVKKQKYSTVSQIRYIFYRKVKNVVNIPNMNPRGFKISIGSLLCEQKLVLESSVKTQNHNYLSYDFLIAEMIRNYVSSDDFVILKQKIWWTQRLKNILQIIMSIQKENSLGLNINKIEVNSIVNLNRILQKNNQFLFEVSDSNKANVIKYVKLDLLITLSYEVKCVTGVNNMNHYFRYNIQSKIEYWAKGRTNFYGFEINQNRQLICVFFSGKEFLGLDQSDQYLSVYLKKCLKSAQVCVRQVQKMWVPMFRLPEKYEERQNTYYGTFKSGDLSSIKKQVIIGQRSEYFCNILMQNGINYEKTKYDLVFEKPFGFAIMTKQNFNLVYSRVII